MTKADYPENGRKLSKAENLKNNAKRLRRVRFELDLNETKIRPNSELDQN